MTLPPADIAPDPAPPPPPRPPRWTHFLTPAAVLIGAAIIAVAILVDRDPAPDAVAPERLSTAAESLSQAARELSQAAAALSAPAQATDAPAEPVSLREALEAYARDLALDPARFRACLEAPAARETVSAHLQRGIAAGVTGTPTFFVNNKRISGAQPAAVFRELIDAELAGSPTSIEAYSPAIQRLAQSDPPSFAILDEAPDIAGAAIHGDPDAPVIVAEFSDFQCPFCQRSYFEALPLIRARAGDGVALAFLHFPLLQIHPNAAGAHLAAECAGAQGKFWEMHDLLFERQEEWAALPNPG